MTKKLTTRSLAEGAIMAGLTMILVLAGSFLPVIGMLFLLICGVPITVVTVRYGGRLGAMSALVAVGLLSILTGPLSGLAYGLQFILIAWIFGWMFSRRKSAVKTISAGIISSMVATVILALLSFTLMGFSTEQFQEMQSVYINDVVDMYDQMGLLEQMAGENATAAEVKVIMEENMVVIYRILPAVLLLISAVSAIVNYLVTVQILKRLKIKIPRLQSFKKMALPANSVWGLILAWGLWLAGPYVPVSWLPIIAQNILLIYGALLFVQGMAVSAYWFNVEKMGMGMKIFTVVFIVFFFVGFIVACAMIGLGDLLFDFRKLRKQQKSV